MQKKYSYIHTNIKLALLTGIILILFNACNKFNEMYEDEIFDLNSEEKAVTAITGAYDRFKLVFLSDYNINFEEKWYLAQNSRGDDLCRFILREGIYTLIDSQLIYSCSGNSEIVPFFNYNYPNAAWYNCYSVITTLNNIIVNSETQKDLIPAVKKILGEAYLLRGYVYFRLVRIYGQVPLIKDVNVSYTIEKSTFEEIYNSIEEDLKMAIHLLPVNSMQARVPYSTPHKGTARAILAEVYLNRAGYPLMQADYYAQAAEILGNIIDSAFYYGYSILPDYADLWRTGAKWHNESVLAIRYTYTGSHWGVGLSNRQRIQDKEGLIHITTLITNFFGPGQKFYNNFPKSYRKSLTFFSLFVKPYKPEKILLFNNYYMDDYSFKYIIEPDQMDLCTPIYYNKFILTTLNDSNYVSAMMVQSDTITEHGVLRPFINYFIFENDYSLYIYRFAQTLLTFAEAKARSGHLDERAYEAVNMIRRRANKVDLYSPSEYDLTPGLTAEQFADSVVWERAWELCAEPEGRWFDLVRLEMVEDMHLLRDENDMLGYPEVIDKSFYFTPIPQAELELNPNLN